MAMGHLAKSLLGLSQVRLAAAVGQQRRMSPDAARLFTEGAPSEVVLPDCTALEPAALASALQDCATPRCDPLVTAFSSNRNEPEELDPDSHLTRSLPCRFA